MHRAVQLRLLAAPDRVAAKRSGNSVKSIRRRILCLWGALLLSGFAATLPAAAQDGMRMIRDTEIENTIRVYIAPLYEAAGLDPNAVKVHLVNDSTLNAFVAGGQRIFIHTGLLMRADSPGQVIGVLAHEIGHITGGHLARMRQGIEDASNQSIIAMLLGGAVAIASGNPQGLAAGATAGATVAQRSILAYTRTMEQSADQAALDFLDRAGLSATGLLDFLQILQQDEKLYSAGGNPYTRSHPLTDSRMEHIRQHVAKSKFSRETPSPLIQSMHRRMRGKLKGFINPPAQTFREYSASNPDIEAKYARAVAHSRTQETDAAVAIMDELIASSPQDPFFYELKGDILKEGGRTEDAIEAYKKTLTILPWAALVRINLARLQIDSPEPGSLERARVNLLDALRFERQMPMAWRFMATVEGRLGNDGEASLALAEESMLRGDRKTAMAHTKRAIERLPQGSPGWLRAQDIETAAQKKEDEG